MTNPSQNNRKLEEMETRLKDLISRSERLDINEKALQVRLDNLHERAYNAVPLSARAGVQPPGITPSEVIKPE